MNEYAIVAEMRQIVFDYGHDIACEYTYDVTKCTLIINAHTDSDTKYRFKNVDDSTLQRSKNIFDMYSNRGLNVFIWALKQHGAEVADPTDNKCSELKVISQEETDVAMTKKLLEDIEEYIGQQCNQKIT